ncbi:MAG: LCP family protein [Clostridia bacterium]|nr:LCP family protein [Clostridia bacterium]
MICTFCIVFATLGGVISAKLVSSIYFGEEIALESLDKQDDVGMVNILLLGVDEGGMRSDTIMLASLNGRTGRLNVLSIPRDTRVLVGNHYQKINAAIGIGAQEVRKGNLNEPEELSVQKVKLLTGLPIHYFMSVNFDGFKEIIDAVDGVEFDVPFRMKYDDPVQGLHIDLQPGLQVLDGEKAHDFVRFRKGNAGYPGYAMGDLGRVEAQQAFIKALISQKVNAKYLLRVDDIFDVVCRNVRTNYTAKDLVKHLGAIRKIKSDSMTMYQLPGSAQTIGGASYYICDDAATAELVETVFSPSAEADKDTEEK